MPRRIKNYLEFLFAVAILIGITFLVIYFSKSQAQENSLKVYFLDVGQGDSSYLKMPDGSDILIDGGPDNTVINELGRVMSFGDREINLVILSHPHADHLSGLVEVLDRYKVDEIWETGVEYPSATYQAWQKEIITKNIPDKFVKIGDERNFGEIKISVLYPLSSLQNQTIDNLNNASIVNRLDYRKFSILYSGDAEISVQKKLLSNSEASNFFVDILKVPHHGSTNGLSEDFLKVVRPAIAVISVGKDNKFGHPAQSTINLLKQYAVRIYRTDQNGTLEIDSDGKSYNLIPSKN